MNFLILDGEKKVENIFEWEKNIFTCLYIAPWSKYDKKIDLAYKAIKL